MLSEHVGAKRVAHSKASHPERSANPTCLRQGFGRQSLGAANLSRVARSFMRRGAHKASGDTIKISVSVSMPTEASA